MGIDDAAHGNNRNVGGATANVDDHIPTRVDDGHSSPNCRHHGLFNKMHFAGFRSVCRIHDSSLFHLGCVGWYANHDSGVNQHFAMVCLLNEVAQHLFGDIEIGYHAISHWFNSHKVGGCTPNHRLRFFTHGFDSSRAPVDCDDGGFINDYAFAACVHQSVGSAQVNGEITREHAEQRSYVLNAPAN